MYTLWVISPIYLLGRLAICHGLMIFSRWGFSLVYCDFIKSLTLLIAMGASAILASAGVSLGMSATFRNCLMDVVSLLHLCITYRSF